MSDGLLGSELNDMVERYLQELHDALRRLPTSQRDQLVSDIREHIVELRAESSVRDRSDMEALLNRVGLPEDIAAVALDGMDDLNDAVPMPVPVTPAVAVPPWRQRISNRVLAGSAVVVVVLALVLGLVFGRQHSGTHVLSFAIGRQMVVPGSLHPPQIVIRPGLPAMPDLIGETEAQAESALSALGLKCTVQAVPSSTVPVGTVVSQSPAAGMPVLLRGYNVVITVSTGPPT
jgi:hypothetical protein